MGFLGANTKMTFRRQKNNGVGNSRSDYGAVTVSNVPFFLDAVSPESPTTFDATSGQKFFGYCPLHFNTDIWDGDEGTDSRGRRFLVMAVAEYEDHLHVTLKRVDVKLTVQP